MSLAGRGYRLEDELTRRMTIGRVALPDHSPVISSPLTVNSPVTMSLALLKRKRSPATLPLIGPLTLSVVEFTPISLRNPVTVAPSCFGSNWYSPGTPAAAPPSSLPYHVPVTSTVTSVRSIQSFCAQLPSTNAMATKTHMALIGARLP